MKQRGDCSKAEKTNAVLTLAGCFAAASRPIVQPPFLAHREGLQGMPLGCVLPHYPPALELPTSLMSASHLVILSLLIICMSLGSLVSSELAFYLKEVFYH